MPTQTTNYSYNKPLVNNATDADLWGGQLNTNWDDIDTDLKAVSDVADAAPTLGEIYPVGSIYIETTGTNPGTTFGVGTWSAFGAGRVLVGLDSGDTDFDTAEETGGSKTHTLTTDEIPAHSHTVKVKSGVNGNANLAGGSQWANLAGGGSAMAHTSTADAEGPPSNNTGGGSAHTIVQPYIVVYMWKRVS